MPFIFLYIIKLSVCLSVVYLFYYFILRKLTFYNWNRYYLFIYSLLSFYIPLIDISGMLQQNDWQSAGLIKWVPAMGNYPLNTWTGSPVLFTTNNILLAVLLSGMFVMLLRLLVQLISFRKLKKKAQPVYNNEMKLYQVDADIIPFSFGNAIFINRQLHNEAELQEVIRHEFVHVKQKHSIDIVWSELLCLLNWYNPFAWLLKNAIRQNLEFIADDKVLENGISKTAYQYLLLKVTGNNQVSIAASFNFSSLKKRIAMMNKMKSAKLHLIKFLFLLPLVAVLLLAFRNSWEEPVSATSTERKVSNAGQAATAATRQPLAEAARYNQDKQMNGQQISVVPVDTVIVPETEEPNDKGYFIEILGNKGKAIIVVKDKNHKEVKRLSMTDWNKKENYYESMYGEIPPPPPPPPPAPAAPVDALPPTAPLPPLPPSETLPPTAPLPPIPPAPPVLPKNVSKLEVDNNKATVWLKNGKKETYDLNVPEQKEKFEYKYQPLPAAPKKPQAAIDL